MRRQDSELDQSITAEKEDATNEMQEQKNFESPRVNYDSNRDFAKTGSDEKQDSETVM